MSNKIFRPHLSTASDARALRTRESLRCALLDLLRLKPLEQIAIRDIAASACIGYTTFFRHHASKETLLNDLAAEQIGHLVGLALPMMETRDSGAASEALFAYVDQQRALWTTLLTGGAAGALRDEFLIELLVWWLRQREPLSIREMAQIYNRIVILPAIGGAEQRRPRAASRMRRDKLQRV